MGKAGSADYDYKPGWGVASLALCCVCMYTLTPSSFTTIYM